MGKVFIAYYVIKISKLWDSVRPYHFLQRSALKRLSSLSESHDVSIYYNCWGADLFSSYDHSRIKIGYIHNHFPKFKTYISHYAKFLDGFLTVNPATTIAIRKCLITTHSGQNIQTVPLPINPPIKMPRAPKQDVIGLVGRINYEQKRYDRLPRFAELLKQKYPHFKIEILGDGPLKNSISTQLKHNKNVRFLPWTEGEDYWKILSNWKYILFLSDYEGLPISLLEAVHSGCIPVYPDFHNGQQQGLQLLLYPKGDMNAAVECTQKPFKFPSKPDAYTTTDDYLKNFTNSLSKVSAVEKTSIPLSLSPRSISYNHQYKKLVGSTPES